jgi:2-octaprenyl-6-methoxyphenol hydroxylase
MADHGMIETDIVIVGGGAVGTAFSVFVAQAGFAVVMIDRQAAANLAAEPFDGRAFAISYGTRRILDAAGIWTAVAAEAEPILEIRVSEARSPFFLHYEHGDLGPDPLGWMVESRHLRRALHALVAQTKGITFLAPTAVETDRRDQFRAELTLADGRRVRASLIVAADGAESPLRSRAGISVTKWDYHQTAIVTTVAHERAHRGIAHEHFRPPGPFAILPLRANRSSLVWVERPPQAAALLALARPDFDRELRQRFGDFLGQVESVGPIWSYPLRLRLANRYVAPRLALLGDSAHTLHPLAGQNLNLAFRDAATLADVLADARRLGEDIGALHVLARYERARRADNLRLFAATDGLNRLFSNDWGWLRRTRGLGLAAVDRLPGLKRLFMAEARGSGGRLPRLGRGERP